MTSKPHDSSLRVIAEQVEKGPQRLFCGHCGRPPDSEAKAKKADPESRVCSSCGMGLLLEAPADVAPTPNDPFLVVQCSLTIRSLSRSAVLRSGMTGTLSGYSH